MNFGSKESFDYIYQKIKDDDYILDFHYRLVPTPRIMIKVTNRRYPEAVTEVFITKAVWDDKEHLAHTLDNFKSNYKDAFKSVKEAANLV